MITIGKAARVASIGLGAWLFLSAFAWPHTPVQMVNAALVGLFITLTAMAAWTTGPPLRLRLFNAVLGLWLLVTAAAFPPATHETVVNAVVVGVLVFLVSLIPQQDKPLRLRTAA
jgi:hypothetical protein